MAVSGHGGASGGGGASSGWDPIIPAMGALPHLPPISPTHIASGRYTTNCIEQCIQKREWESIWASYPIGWDPSDDELFRAFLDLYGEYDYWEIYGASTSYPPMSEGNSRYRAIGPPADLCETRALQIEWMGCSVLISSVSLQFGEIGGYPRVKMFAVVRDYQCFEMLSPPPPPPPPPPIMGMPGGEGSDGRVFVPSFLILGGGALWRKKRLF